MRLVHEIEPTLYHDWNRFRGRIAYAIGYRLGFAEGLRRGVIVCLGIRFGSISSELSSRIESITDPTVLELLLKAVEYAPDLDAVRALLPPQA